MSYLAGVLFTIILGGLLHFVYVWSGCSPVVALFAPVNESVFEHLKLLFTPYLLWSLIVLGKSGLWERNFFPRKSFSVLAGMLTIVIGFYTYTRIFHRHFFAADLALFIFAVILTFFIDYRLSIADLPSGSFFCTLGTLLMLALVLLFPVLTFCPPSLNLFREV